MTAIDDTDRKDCVAALVASQSLGLSPNDITSMEVLDGGLLHCVLKVKTRKGEFYAKKYGRNLSNGSPSPAEVPAPFRAALAHRTQALAKEAVHSDNISVPAVMPLTGDGTVLIMESTKGTSTLFPFLCNGTVDEDLLVAIVRALGQLHQLSAEKMLANDDYANKALKEYKVALQYHHLTEALEADEAAIVRNIAQWYLADERCVTHGDMSSRNVIVDDAQKNAALVEFEQSHRGSPAYDLAHLLSEYAISCIARRKSPEKLLARAIAAHANVAPAFDPLQVAEEFTLHLACQVIFRFVGPHHRSWTGHIAVDAARLIVERARSWIRHWPIPILALI